jgi:hypothetical protein
MKILLKKNKRSCYLCHHALTANEHVSVRLTWLSVSCCGVADPCDAWVHRDCMQTSEQLVQVIMAGGTISLPTKHPEEGVYAHPS